MKRYILYIMLLLYTTLSAATTHQSNIYDRELIVKDFVDRNVTKYKVDNFPYFSIEKIKNEGFLHDEYLTRSIPSYVEDTEIIWKQIYRCPPGSGDLSGDGDFTTTLYKLNPYTNTMTCLVAKKGVLEKPIALFQWKLSDFPSYDGSYDEFLTPRRLKMVKDNQGLIEASESDFEDLQAAKVVASNLSEQEGANTGIPHLIAASILGDGNLIDIQNTIDHRTLILKDGFKMKGANFLRAKEVSEVAATDATFTGAYNLTVDDAGGYLSWIVNLATVPIASLYGTLNIELDPSHKIKVKKLSNEMIKDNIKSSNIINERMITMLEWYPKWNTLNQDFFLMIVSLIGLIAVAFYTVSRVAQHADEHKQDHNSYAIIWMGTLVGAAVLFLPTTKEDINVDGKALALTQSNFNKLEVASYYTTIDFANLIAKSIIDSEFNSMLRRTGAINTESLINTLVNQDVLEKEKDIYSSFLTQCNSIFDFNLIKSYSDNKNSYYPVSEQWIYAAYTAKGRIPRYYMSKDEGGLLNFDNQNSYPDTSSSFCRKADERFLYIKNQMELNQALITKASAGADPKKIENLTRLVHMQYGLFEDWNFMSILALPVIVNKSEFMGTLFEETQKDTATKLLDDERGEDLAKNIAYNTSLFMIPGVSNFYNLLKDHAGKIVASLGATGGSAAGVPGSVVGGIIGSIAGFVASSSFSYFTTVYFVRNLIELLPSVGISLLGLLIILKIIIKIFTYHLIAPFVLVMAFTKRSGQIIVNYMSRVITIALEIPIFVISVFAAMAASDILLAIGQPLISTIFKISSEITHDQGDEWTILTHGLDYVFLGLANLALQLFSFAIVYKILKTYHAQIFEAVEAKTATAFDDVVEKMSSSVQSGWGQRI